MDGAPSAVVTSGLQSGRGLILDEVEGAVYNLSPVTHAVTIPTTMPPPTGIAEETASSITYSGSWSRVTCGCANGYEKASVISGNTATFHWTGTKASGIATKGPKGGTAAVYVDGVLKATINLYAATATDRVAVYTPPTLTSKAHTLKVKLTAAKRVNVDQFRYQ